jgi:hypothetical protein
MKYLKLCVYFHYHFENLILKVSTNVEKNKFGCFVADKKIFFSLLKLPYFSYVFRTFVLRAISKCGLVIKKIKIGNIQMLPKVGKNGLMLTLDNVSSVLKVKHLFT